MKVWDSYQLTFPVTFGVQPELPPGYFFLTFPSSSIQKAPLLSPLALELNSLLRPFLEIEHWTILGFTPPLTSTCCQDFPRVSYVLPDLDRPKDYRCDGVPSVIPKICVWSNFSVSVNFHFTFLLEIYPRWSCRPSLWQVTALSFQLPPYSLGLSGFWSFRVYPQ